MKKLSKVVFIKLLENIIFILFNNLSFVLIETDYSSVDLEIQIQNERILSILNEMIYKTEIVIFLLHFDENNQVSIKNILSDDHFLIVKEFCTKSEFLEEFSDSNNYEVITDDHIQKVIFIISVFFLI